MSISRRLALVVVDDRQLRSACLAGFLKEAAELHGMEVAEMDPADPVAIARSLSWKICILNVGADASDDRWQFMIRMLNEAGRNRSVVVMSDSDDPAKVRAALAAGARGYILTTLNPRIAISALRFIGDGGTYFPASAIAVPGPGLDPVQTCLPEVAKDPFSPVLRDEGARSDFASKASSPDPSRTPTMAREEDVDEGVLTPRQSAVLEHLCDAKSNKEIARLLNTTEATVKVHIRQIMRKLGAKNRTEAALIASRPRPCSSIDLGAAAAAAAAAAVTPLRDPVPLRNGRPPGPSFGSIGLRA